MKRCFLLLTALWLGHCAAFAAQGPSANHDYSVRLDFDPAFADGEQVVIHQHSAKPDSPAILWVSGKLDTSNPAPRPLPILRLKRLLKRSTGTITEESEASLEVYGADFGCALDLKHASTKPEADETYEIYLDGKKITTLTPAWIASWAFNPAAEVFFPLQRRADGAPSTVQFRVGIVAHPAKSGAPQSVTFERAGKTASATENAGIYSAPLAANGAPPDPRLFIKVRDSTGVATGVVPWVQTGPLVFVVGDHGTQYFRSKAGAGNMAEVSLRDVQGRAVMTQESRCWYWDAGTRNWTLSTGDAATQFASARYFFDGWRAAAQLMEKEGAEAGAMAAGFAFVDEKTPFPPIIDPSQWEPGLISGPVNSAWEPPNDLRTQLGEPAVVMWCVGLSDARARTWKVIFDPAAHANEASEEYLKRLRDALAERIARWKPDPNFQPTAPAPQHVVIPPAEAFAGTLTFDSTDTKAPSRIGAQTVQNALNSPKATWVAVTPAPAVSTAKGPTTSVPAFNSIRAYSLGWALGLQYTLPAGP